MATLDIPSAEDLMQSFNTPDEPFSWHSSETQIPDLDELFAAFSNLDPRNESFRLSDEPVAEDWFSEAPGAELYKIDSDYFTADFEHAEKESNSFFPAVRENVQYIKGAEEDIFPEPDEDEPRQSLFVLKRREKARKRMLRLATTVFFFALCIGLMVGAGFFAYSKLSESTAINKYAYSVQSPTMTPGPGDVLARMREGAG